MHLVMSLRKVFLGIVASMAVFCTTPYQLIAQDESPSWEELRAHPYPEWFRDAKLGIFVHWGIYSVPAYSGKEQYAEWFLRGLQLDEPLRVDFMRENFGSDFTYRDFAPLFKAELFDPDEWAHLFSNAGARYVVLVSKHHDGYALWPSQYAPDWNSVHVGPERDLVGDLTNAVRSVGLRMGLYYSLAEWNNPLHRWYADPPDSIGTYVEQHMIPQFKELISAYRPHVLFTDGEWLNSAEQWHARELIHWYFETVGPNAIVNDRWGGGSNIGFRTPEYSAGIVETERPWAEVRGLGRSFGLNRNESLDAYMTPNELIERFARAVAAGGGLILNVGPKADGQIPLLQQERLMQLGEWLGVNGAAIYGSRPWTRTGEERDVTLERIDAAIDFDWVRNSPGRPIREDDFSAAWAGFIEVPTTGSYSFDAEADDHARVWIDGELVFEKWEERGAGSGEQAGRSVALESGRRYPIRIDYYEKELQASVRLFWESDNLPREVIPSDFLFTSSEAGAVHGLNAVYGSKWQHLAYTTKNDTLFAITFEWPDVELAVPIPEPDEGTAVYLLGHDGELPWRFENDTVFVDLSGVAYSEVPGQWAWTVGFGGYLNQN